MVDINYRVIKDLQISFLAKYRTDGTCIWAVRAGGDGTDVPKSIVVDQKGNVLIAGNFTSEADFWVIKVDSKGFI